MAKTHPMKPLLTLIIAGTSVAMVAATVPSIGERLLNAAVATAWSQQDRDRGDKNSKKEREERDEDRDRGKGGDGRDDRDSDRGGSTDKGNTGREDRDTDRGGGGESDKGSNGREDRDTDRGGSSDGSDKGSNGREDRDSDRGGSSDGSDKGSNGREDRDSDRGGSGGGGGSDKGNTGRDDHDTDRGGAGNDKGNKGRDDRDNDRGPNADNPTPGKDDIITTIGGADTDIADRSADPANRLTGADPDRDREALAGRFDLEDSETFDNDGFLARRGEIIAMSSDTLLRRRAEALGLQVVQQDFLASLNTTMYRISVPAASPIDGILARLRAQDPDGVFDRNHLYDRSASTVSNDAGTPTHALTGSAKGVTVGLIDTGVNALHPALRGTNVQLNYFVDQSRELPETHGTAVVSLLVSKDFGMLPDAQLYVACVFYEDRRGGSLSEARDLVRALDWLMKLKVPVINMSLSGPPNEVLRAAIQRAVQAGHLIVAAVGNGGPASPPLYPAAYDGVIAVTAVDGGQHVYRRASRGAHVQLAAMGVDVVAAAPAGVATYSGTSFASPYVAALAAMDYRSLDPQKANEVKESLQADALDLGKPGRDEVYGYGLARPRAISTASR
jgi:subtilisin family serine protease